MQLSMREYDTDKKDFKSKVKLAGEILRQIPIIPILILFFVLILPSIAADLIAPHHPTLGVPAMRLQPPVFFGGSWEYPFGTDQIGRCIFSRVIHGASVSLSVALVGIFVGGFIGTTLGLIAGYFGGKLDALIMRLVETTMSIPLILLALALAMALGPSFRAIIIVIVIVLWAYYARQIRGEVLGLRERDFIDRARVSGASDFRIIIHHILPNVINTLVVLASLQVAVVIIMEATLSFLGLGLPRPYPAWGLMVADGRTLIVSAWWIAFFPGLAIVLTVLALNLLGDWLRDRLDPKLRQI